MTRNQHPPVLSKCICVLFGTIVMIFSPQEIGAGEFVRDPSNQSVVYNHGTGLQIRFLGRYMQREVFVGLCTQGIRAGNSSRSRVESTACCQWRRPRDHPVFLRGTRSSSGDAMFWESHKRGFAAIFGQHCCVRCRQANELSKDVPDGRLLDCLKLLAALNGLHSLDLSGTSVTDAGLKTLVRFMRGIINLPLDRLSITADGIQCLAELP